MIFISHFLNKAGLRASHGMAPLGYVLSLQETPLQQYRVHAPDDIIRRHALICQMVREMGFEPTNS